MTKLKRRTRNIISIILVTLLTFGLGFGIYSIVSTKTKTISPTIFSVGGVNGTNGKHIENKKTLYNEEFIECQGLRIERDFESTVQYSIYYYDVGEKYLGSVDCKEDSYALSGDYANARYCRIVINPGKSSDINIFEKYSIAKQLKITVDKNQNYVDNHNVFNLNQRNENGGFTVSKTEDIATLTFGKNSDCYAGYVQVAEESEYTAKRMVILSSYDLTAKGINAVYKTGNTVPSGSSVTGTEINLNNKDVVDSFMTRDGYYAYVINLNIDAGSDCYVVFNYLTTQDYPQVYLYSTAPGTQS